MKVSTALISLSFAIAFGAGYAFAQPAFDPDGVIVTGPPDAPADTPLADPIPTAPASNGPIAFASAPLPARPAEPQRAETVTADELTEAERAATAGPRLEISPGVALESRPVNEEQAAGGLLRSNPGLQRPDRKNFGLGFKF